MNDQLMRESTPVSMVSHRAYLVLAEEIPRAHGEDDLVGVENTNLGVRELEFDIRACGRVVEPASLDVNIDLYQERSAGQDSPPKSSHVDGASTLVVE
jgi:hypothetical protein